MSSNKMVSRSICLGNLHQLSADRHFWILKYETDYCLFNLHVFHPQKTSETKGKHYFYE